MKPYLIPSGIADNTNLFIRAMSYGYNDLSTPTQPNATLPTCPHQMIRINNETVVYAPYNDSFWTKYGGLVGTVGYLATFLEPTITGWKVREAWNYHMWATASGASGLRDKLIEQSNGTLLVLSSHDTADGYLSTYSGELVNNWGANALTGALFRSAYTLISAKNGKVFYEELSEKSGQAGFCGWIKVGNYNTGLRYNEISGYMGTTMTGNATTNSIYTSSVASGSGIHAAGFLKTHKSGNYSFKLVSNDIASLWMGDEAVNEYETGQAILVVNDETGIYTTGLRSNTYYPFRLIHHNEQAAGICQLEYKHAADSYSSILPAYHTDYQKGYYYYENDGLLNYFSEGLAAAYSVYNLGNKRGVVTETEGEYINPTVRIRRDSDNEHKSFTEAEIISEEALDWVNEDVQKLDEDGAVDNSQFTTVNVTLTYGFDSGDTGYDSVLKISANTGSVNYAQSISLGVTAGQLVTITMKTKFVSNGGNQPRVYIGGDYVSIPSQTSWTSQSYQLRVTSAGAASPYLRLYAAASTGGAAGDVLLVKDVIVTVVEANGHVAELYDQGGNDYDAAQSTAANQPKIVDAGAYVTDANGNISLLFDGGNDYLAADSLATLFSGTDQPLSAFTVAEYSAVTANIRLWTIGSSSATTPVRLLGNSTTATPDKCTSLQYSRDDAAVASSLSSVDAIDVDTTLLFSSLDLGNSHASFINGVSGGSDTTNLGAVTLNKFSIGAQSRVSVDSWHDGYITTLVLYAADKSTDRAQIEYLLANKYGITL